MAANSVEAANTPAATYSYFGTDTRDTSTDDHNIDPVLSPTCWHLVPLTTSYVEAVMCTDAVSC